ncbi:MAG: plasmid mobilization relaxosome protein MobC [Pseudomonas balearica]|nr:plasmid mobilization relaxosome protein MobC [Stutzerimonas balearica]
MKAPEADPALLAALARAGNNLNQIGRWANTYKSNADAVQVLAALVGIEQILSSYRPGVSGAEPLTEGGE